MEECRGKSKVVKMIVDRLLDLKHRDGGIITKTTLKKTRQINSELLQDVKEVKDSLRYTALVHTQCGIVPQKEPPHEHPLIVLLLSNLTFWVFV